MVKVWVHKRFQTVIVKHLNLPEGGGDESRPQRYIFQADDGKTAKRTIGLNRTLSVCKQPHTVTLYTLQQALVAAGVDEVRVQCYAQKGGGCASPPTPALLPIRAAPTHAHLGLPSSDDVVLLCVRIDRGSMQWLRDAIRTLPVGTITRLMMDIAAYVYENDDGIVLARSALPRWTTNEMLYGHPMNGQRPHESYGWVSGPLSIKQAPNVANAKMYSPIRCSCDQRAP